MSFKDVLGHSRPIEMLQRAIQRDKVAHSYLFLGNEGIGKKWVALQFAKAINCLEQRDQHGDACNHCLACKKIDHRLHPDVSFIEPEGQTIKVDQVRQTWKELVYRPYEGRRRVFILTAADRMAPNMSNILLKTLEEPPLHTVIILLANHPRLLLPTLLSRCQRIHFHPLSVPLVREWLTKERGLNQGEAHLLASLSEGSPGKALELKDKISQINREDLLEGWVGSRALSFERIEKWVDLLPSEREGLLLILEVGGTLLRDLVVMKLLKNGSKLIHSDLLPKMKETAFGWSLPTLLKRMEALHRATFAIRGNANTTLALEAMMLSWAEG